MVCASSRWLLRAVTKGNRETWLVVKDNRDCYCAHVIETSSELTSPKFLSLEYFALHLEPGTLFFLFVRRGEKVVSTSN